MQTPVYVQYRKGHHTTSFLWLSFHFRIPTDWNPAENKFSMKHKHPVSYVNQILLRMGKCMGFHCSENICSPSCIILEYKYTLAYAAAYYVQEVIDYEIPVVKLRQNSI